MGPPGIDLLLVSRDCATNFVLLVVGITLLKDEPDEIPDTDEENNGVPSPNSAG